jgi:2-dehydropantoate 2-reductase
VDLSLHNSNFDVKRLTTNHQPATSSTLGEMMIPNKSIHILGLGNLGKLVAHSLRKSHPEKQISLLFHRESLVEEWNRSGRNIQIERNGESDCRDRFGEESTKKGGDIHNLVVATKTYLTVQALLPLKERLRSDSTILFVQNGMGEF